MTYRVVAGVSLASCRPGRPPRQLAAGIEAWRAEAREFGWVPAVLGASERRRPGLRRRRGMRVLLLGDEAILDPRPLRPAPGLAVARAPRGRAGDRRRTRRCASGASDELRRRRAAPRSATRAEAWRSGETDRGFSMALGRAGDPADGDVLHVTAHRCDGSLVGVLSLRALGRSGVSLDVMRRSPDAPNGVTELMVSELLARARQLGSGPDLAQLLHVPRRLRGRRAPRLRAR